MSLGPGEPHGTLFNLFAVVKCMEYWICLVFLLHQTDLMANEGGKEYVGHKD